MRWCFLAQGEDRGRMQSRVTQIVEHLLMPMSCFSLTRLEDRLIFNLVVEADEKQALRLESLLRKVYGMLSVDVSSEASTMQRMIALFRVRCDSSERNELLHFIGALHARVLMIRPLWVAFEIIGMPSEVEGIYQSVLGYGVVDQVSSSRAFLSSGYESKRSADEASKEYVESGEQEASLT
jgi:acetolactate synthase small subunit